MDIECRISTHDHTRLCVFCGTGPKTGCSGNPGNISPKSDPINNVGHKFLIPLFPIYCQVIAEIVLVLAGHSLPLFLSHRPIEPALLLRLGEHAISDLSATSHRDTASEISYIASSKSYSQYLSVSCDVLNQIPRFEANFVVSVSFVQLPTTHATFSEWNAPLIALEDSPGKHGPPVPRLTCHLSRDRAQAYTESHPSPRLSRSVQKVLRSQLSTLIVHTFTGHLSVGAHLRHRIHADRDRDSGL